MKNLGNSQSPHIVYLFICFLRYIRNVDGVVYSHMISFNTSLSSKWCFTPFIS